jgi:NAD(P)-dependent dehydrogenase (short-subunit alcohol dehydrogenase family)
MMKRKLTELSVLITGGTCGIGFAMAREFLKKGHTVTICGRSAKTLNNALVDLSAYAPRLLGISCDVLQVDQVRQLWQIAIERFKKVDIWINNAGISQLSKPIWEIEGGQVTRIINVNISGAIYGSQVAMFGMLDQGHGQIFNMEGWGSNGRHTNDPGIYGTTKAAIRYFTEGLVQESQSAGVLVGSLSPGMVITDLLLEPLRQSTAQFTRVRKIINLIADKPERVAQYLVTKILKNDKHGVRFSWLNPFKLFTRFIRSPFVRRDIGINN